MTQCVLLACSKMSFEQQPAVVFPVPLLGGDLVCVLVAGFPGFVWSSCDSYMLPLTHSLTHSPLPASPSASPGRHLRWL